MTHVKTSPYYPQSNGKIERFHKTLKGECIRVQVPLSLDDARRLVLDYVEHYNNVRLHSAIGYVAPKDKLEGREQQIFDERDRKLAEARATTPTAATSPTRASIQTQSQCSAARHRFCRRPRRHLYGSRPAIARFHAQQRVRSSTTRTLPLAWLHFRDQPLFLRQPGRPVIPLLQMRLLGQCFRPVGKGQTLVPLQRSDRSVRASPHPLADTAATTTRNREEELVACSQSTCTMNSPLNTGTNFYSLTQRSVSSRLR